MFYLYAPGIVMLSATKSGSTSIDRAFSARAALSIPSPPGVKHMTYKGFMADLMPFMESAFGVTRDDLQVVDIMREPVGWVRSWFRYLSREQLADPTHPRHGFYTGNMSFDEFVEIFCSPAVANWPMPKNPTWRYLDEDGEIGADRLFMYEHLDQCVDWFNERVNGSVRLPHANRSVEREAELSPKSQRLLLKHLAGPLDFYHRLSPTGEIPARDASVPA